MSRDAVHSMGNNRAIHLEDTDSKALTVARGHPQVTMPPPSQRLDTDQGKQPDAGTSAGDKQRQTGRQLTRRKSVVNVKVPAFLNKLYKYALQGLSIVLTQSSMVEDPDTDDLIHWSEQGLSVLGIGVSTERLLLMISRAA